MRKYNIEYSENSKKDLIEIKQYIKNNLQEPETAQKIISKIRKEINNLKNNPDIYAIIDDDMIKKIQVRKLVVKIGGSSKQKTVSFCIIKKSAYNNAD